MTTPPGPLTMPARQMEEALEHVCVCVWGYTADVRLSPEPLATHKLPRQKHRFLACHSGGGTHGGHRRAWLDHGGASSPTRADMGAHTC